MRMAHLYPTRVIATHHEIHLTESEARQLTTELSQDGFIWKQAEARPLLFKVFSLLGARNTHGDKVREDQAFSYYSHRSLD